MLSWNKKKPSTTALASSPYAQPPSATASPYAAGTMPPGYAMAGNGAMAANMHPAYGQAAYGGSPAVSPGTPMATPGTSVPYYTGPYNMAANKAAGMPTAQNGFYAPQYGAQPPAGDYSRTADLRNDPYASAGNMGYNANPATATPYANNYNTTPAQDSYAQPASNSYAPPAGNSYGGGYGAYQPPAGNAAAGGMTEPPPGTYSAPSNGSYTGASGSPTSYPASGYSPYSTTPSSSYGTPTGSDMDNGTAPAAGSTDPYHPGSTGRTSSRWDNSSQVQPVNYNGSSTYSGASAPGGSYGASPYGGTTNTYPTGNYPAPRQ